MVSSDERLRVQFKNWREPNNGRMLWEVEVTLDEIIINDLIFKDEWNYLNFEIEKLELTNEERSFYYIPVESTSKLIESKTKKVIELPFYGVSTVRFQGNKFQFDRLIQIYSDTIIITHLSTFESMCYEKTFDGHIMNAIFKSKENLELTYYTIKNGLRSEHQKNIASSDFTHINRQSILEHQKPENSETKKDKKTWLQRLLRK